MDYSQPLADKNYEVLAIIKAASFAMGEPTPEQLAEARRIVNSDQDGSARAMEAISVALTSMGAAA